MKSQSSLVKTAIFLFGVAIVVGGVVFFYRQYTDTSMSIKRLEQENTILENRIEILSSSSGELDGFVNTAYRSIPESNAGLLAINSIKGLRGEDEMLIDGVYVKSSLVEEGLQQTTEVGFEVEGEVNVVFSFLRKLAASLPLLKLKELETRVTNASSATSTVRMETYSRSLPKELPSLKESLPSLSQEDQRLLAELENYNYPSIEVAQQSDGEVTEGQFGRENPFSGISGTLSTE